MSQVHGNCFSLGLGTKTVGKKQMLQEAGGPLSRAGQVSMVATHRDGAAGASLLMTCTLGLKPEMWRESTEAACLCLGNRAKST